jgi:hypothetical protein
LHHGLLADRLVNTCSVTARSWQESVVVSHRFGVSDPSSSNPWCNPSRWGPNFGLASTRDELTEQLMLELHELRLRQRKGKISKSEQERLEQLSFEFERTAAPVGSFDDLAAWREQTDQIRAYAKRIRENRK